MFINFFKKKPYLLFVMFCLLRGLWRYTNQQNHNNEKKRQIALKNSVFNKNDLKQIYFIKIKNNLKEIIQLKNKNSNLTQTDFLNLNDVINLFNLANELEKDMYNNGFSQAEVTICHVDAEIEAYKDIYGDQYKYALELSREISRRSNTKLQSNVINKRDLEEAYKIKIKNLITEFFNDNFKSLIVLIDFNKKISGIS